jgi:ferritin
MNPESMISPTLADAINAQIGREFEASLQYASIAGYFDGDSLPELAAFFFRQSDEERMHAMKFVHYLLETGGRLRIPALAEPRHDFDSAEDAATAALHWEIEVTRQINALVDIALDERDHIAGQFLQWFVAEQREEVSSMTTLRDVIRRAGPMGLLFVEQYLARSGGAGGPGASAEMGGM